MASWFSYYCPHKQESVTHIKKCTKQDDIQECYAIRQHFAMTSPAAAGVTVATTAVSRTSTEVHVVLPSVSWVCALALVVWLETPLKNFAAVVVTILPLAADAAVGFKRQNNLHTFAM